MKNGKINLKRKDAEYLAGFGIIQGNLKYLENKLSNLHENEITIYNQLKFEKRKISYLLGRLAGRIAISEIISSNNTKKIYISSGVFLFPVVKGIQSNNLQLTITHSDEIGIAFAYPEEHPIGIDLEKISEGKIEIIASQMKDTEINLAKNTGLPNEVSHTLLWTVKEAFSKVLRTGLTMDMNVFEIANIEKSNDFYFSTFKNSIQYKAISLISDLYVFTIVLPKNTEVNLNDFYFNWKKTV